MAKNAIFEYSGPTTNYLLLEGNIIALEEMPNMSTMFPSLLSRYTWVGTAQLRPSVLGSEFLKLTPFFFPLFWDMTN